VVDHWKEILYNLHLNRCVARVCCKSDRHWLSLMAARQQLHTDNRWVWRRSRPSRHDSFRCMQAIAADTVIAYITHDNRHDSVKPALSEATWRLVTFIRTHVTFCRLAMRFRNVLSDCSFRYAPLAFSPRSTHSFFPKASLVVCYQSVCVWLSCSCASCLVFLH